MAIALDTSTNGSNNSGASLTFSHTCTGSNLVLVVAVGNQAGDTTTGVTYNGVSMTQIGKHVAQGATTEYYLYYLLSPATGAHNVVISRPSDASQLYGVSASYTGVAYLDASATAGAAASPMSLTVVTVADNCWVVAGGGGANNSLAAGTGMTGRQFTTGQLGIGDSNAAITPAGSTNIAFTGGGTINFGGIVASFAPETGNRYWVGGTGNWDSSTTTHWATASGGTGGVSVPTTTFPVFFDASSGAGTVTLTTSPTVLSVNMTATSVGLSLGSNTISLSGTGTVWTGAGTITAGTSTINLTNSSSSAKTFSGGGKTYYNLTFTSGSSGTYTLSGANTFNNFYYTGSGTGALTIGASNTFVDFKVDTPPHTVNFTAGTTQTLQTFTVNGTAGNLMTLQSTSAGSSWYLVKSTTGTVSCDYLSLRDSHVS